MRDDDADDGTIASATTRDDANGDSASATTRARACAGALAFDDARESARAVPGRGGGKKKKCARDDDDD